MAVCRVSGGCARTVQATGWKRSCPPPALSGKSIATRCYPARQLWQTYPPLPSTLSCQLLQSQSPSQLSVKVLPTPTPPPATWVPGGHDKRASFAPPPVRVSQGRNSLHSPCIPCLFFWLRELRGMRGCNEKREIWVGGFSVYALLWLKQN